MKKIIIAIIIGTMIVCSVNNAQAQIGDGVFLVYQNNKHVGVIYTLSRDEDESEFVEYWYLFKDYVYSGKDADVSMVLEPSTNKYSSLEEFIAEMREEYPGGRYLLVKVNDYKTGGKRVI